MQWPWQLLQTINERLGKIMATQAEVVQQLTDLKNQVAKIATETKTLIQKVTDLTDEIAKGEVKPEVQAALDALKAQVQVVDDLVPDAPST